MSVTSRFARHGLIAMALVMAPSYALATELTFLCSWQDRAPMQIKVDVGAATATRADGGTPYRLVKLSDLAVWLETSEADRPDRLAVQMIERRPAGSSEGGAWLDLTVGYGGVVSPIVGGVCWEQ